MDPKTQKKNWQRLHRLVYVATSLGVLHFYWQVKADTYWPIVATTVLVSSCSFVFGGGGSEQGIRCPRSIPGVDQSAGLAFRRS